MFWSSYKKISYSTLGDCLLPAGKLDLGTILSWNLGLFKEAFLPCQRYQPIMMILMIYRYMMVTQDCDTTMIMIMTMMMMLMMIFTGT